MDDRMLNDPSNPTPVVRLQDLNATVVWLTQVLASQDGRWVFDRHGHGAPLFRRNDSATAANSSSSVPDSSNVWYSRCAAGVVYHRKLPTGEGGMPLNLRFSAEDERFRDEV